MPCGDACVIARESRRPDTPLHVACRCRSPSMHPITSCWASHLTGGHACEYRVARLARGRCAKSPSTTVALARLRPAAMEATVPVAAPRGCGVRPVHVV